MRLDADEAAARAAALQQRERELSIALEKDILRLEKEIERARDQNAADAASARAAVRAREEELDATIAVEARKRLPEAFASFVKEPTRAAVLAIVRVWKDLHERARREVGQELSARWLSSTMLDALGRSDAAAVMGLDLVVSNYSYIDANHFYRTSTALLKGTPEDAADALRSLEEGLRRWCGGERRVVPEAHRLLGQERRAAMDRCATERWTSRAVTAVDEAQRRAGVALR